MQVIKARNVNDAYAAGLALLRSEGEERPSRAGPVLVMPCPVTTAYSSPVDRVLYDPVRDANPFLHLFEALWMLAGEHDARWLDRFVHDFSARFAEDGGIQHGAYGYRWRRHFDMEGGGCPGLPDQLDTVVRLLKEDPDDRRAVLTMWDPVADLGASKRDIPCNTHLYPRIREVEGPRPRYYDEGLPVGMLGTWPVLDITVCCRSNDAVWGAYGANVVHFSILQEYLAGRLSVGVGEYYQISNNFHAYRAVLDKLDARGSKLGFSGALRGAVFETSPIGLDWDRWDTDLRVFMDWSTRGDLTTFPHKYPHNPWFHETAEPLFIAHSKFKQGQVGAALDIFDDYQSWPNMSPDWRAVAKSWIERRRKP